MGQRRIDKGRALMEWPAAPTTVKLGYVETDELAVYVRRRVMAMTKGLQEPVACEARCGARDEYRARHK